MVIFAAAMGVGSYLLVELNLFNELPANWPVVAAIWLLIAVGAHLAVRFRIPYADPLILPCVLLLNGIGLAMIHRIDKIPDPVRHDATTQLMWTGIGVGLFLLVLFLLRDHRPLQGYTYTLFVAGLGLLLMPLLPFIGKEVYGSRIWIAIGPYTFQPAEVAKIVLAIAFASYLVEKRDVLALAGARFLGIDLPRPRDLGPILLMWLASLAVLVFQRDLGTSLLFFGLFVMMLYVATERPSWPILGLLLFSAGAYAGFLLFSHVQVRVDGWLHPFDNFDQNNQIINGQFGIAWGGLLGRGWGLGRPGLTTFAKSDFIAAAIGEELGMAGLMAVIMVYALIVARGLRTALAAKEPFGKLLSAGLSFVLALQVFTIIGGVTRLLPLTGQTTPFLSQGGSSLVANWAIVGLLLAISHQARKPVARVSADPLAGPAYAADGFDSDTTQVIRGDGRAQR
ncbi:cell division protein [Enemella dayhoffiae]|uniref:Cell division protein n=1 Tax=Enemella dayhoffiae TaxID=2016507 RepID=A0A255HC81_9ACTN|nr:FtsW/RodA/SpoVE family cell cycle protein [Enemella dayhoffiae]OYO25361.1 cell division protein [Enemella dayhoffiae]